MLRRKTGKLYSLQYILRYEYLHNWERVLDCLQCYAERQESYTRCSVSYVTNIYIIGK